MKVLSAQVFPSITTATEVRRQQQRFLISTWAGDPDRRDAVGAIVSAAMADIDGLPLPNSSCTQVPLYRALSIHSMDEKQGVYRRDESYDIEYPTLRIETVPPVLFPQAVGINNAMEVVAVSPPTSSPTQDSTTEWYLTLL